MIYHIYCDESRQCQHRYMVIGGIILEESHVKAFENTMTKYRQETNVTQELKWSKISASYLNKYKRFVDYFFALINNDKIHFKCIIVDTHQIQHKKYSGGDKELSFYKMYYQLLLHKFLVKYYRDEDKSKFIICMDNRTSSYSLTEFRDILNRGFVKKTDIQYHPVANVEARDSKKSEVIQINDLILGAIGFQKNGIHLVDGSSAPKKELAKYISNGAGMADLTKNTSWGQHRFEIWNIDLNRRK